MDDEESWVGSQPSREVKPFVPGSPRPLLRASKGNLICTPPKCTDSRAGHVALKPTLEPTGKAHSAGAKPAIEPKQPSLPPPQYMLGPRPPALPPPARLLFPARNSKFQERVIAGRMARFPRQAGTWPAGILVPGPILPRSGPASSEPSKVLGADKTRCDFCKSRRSESRWKARCQTLIRLLREGRQEDATKTAILFVIYDNLNEGETDSETDILVDIAHGQ